MELMTIATIAAFSPLAGAALAASSAGSWAAPSRTR